MILKDSKPKEFQLGQNDPLLVLALRYYFTNKSGNKDEIKGQGSSHELSKTSCVIEAKFSVNSLHS